MGEAYRAGETKKKTLEQEQTERKRGKGKKIKTL